MVPLWLLQLLPAALLILSYALSIVAAKWWIFPGWAWRGFFSELDSLITLFTLLAVSVFAFLWRIYRGKEPDESLSTTIRRVLLSSVGLKRTLVGLVLLDSAIIVALLVIGEREPFRQFLDYSEESNWQHANLELEELRKDPVRPELLKSLDLFLRAHRASEKDLATDSSALRADRAAVQALLTQGEDHGRLNTLAFAELSKHLYFKERKDDLLMAQGVAAITNSLPRAKNDSEKSLLLAKLGELLLATQDYAAARVEFQKALTIQNRPQVCARLIASISNTYAAQGEWNKAIEQYRKAEKFYPQGRLEIFFSNLGYMLCQSAFQEKLAGNKQSAIAHLAEAEEKVRKALDIKSDDWLSFLNLALIQDELEKPTEAQKNYNTVIEKAAQRELVAEAWILYGRSMELAAVPMDEIVKALLLGLGRVADEKAIMVIAADTGRYSELYLSAAAELKRLPPHGIERYIEWFSTRATGLANQHRP